jgi:hypothetical protein
VSLREGQERESRLRLPIIHLCPGCASGPPGACSVVLPLDSPSKNLRLTAKRR